MARQAACIFAVALACSVPASAATQCETPEIQADQRGGKPADSSGQKKDERRDERRTPWWKAADTRAELGISDKQSNDIDEVFQATFPSLRAAKEQLDKLDEQVARTIKEGVADVATVDYQVAQAEQARAKLATARTTMLYRMHRLLSREQRAKLDAMFERREAERRKPKDSDGRR
jgi:Spy/CpxP family protein refolding chaperone